MTDTRELCEDCDTENKCECCGHCTECEARSEILNVPKQKDGS